MGTSVSLIRQVRPTTKTSLFRETFKHGTQSWRGSGRLFQGAVKVNITALNKIEVRILNIETIPILRRNNYATECMEWLCELADDLEVQLTLAPCSDDSGGMDNVRLTAWYQKFGFVRLYADEMVRYPVK